MGQALSFVVAGVLVTGSAGLGRVVMLLALGPVVAAVLIAMVLPETGGRELEDISPSPAAALVVPELP